MWHECLENETDNNSFAYYRGMSVKNTGDRSVLGVLNRKKRLAIIAISMTGIIFGVLFYFLSNN